MSRELDSYNQRVIDAFRANGGVVDPALDLLLLRPVGARSGRERVTPLAYWRVMRGTSQKALRAVYEVPAEKGFVVGDIKINGQKIGFGAQITDSVTIKLTGLATRLGQVQEPPLMGCKRTHQARAVAAAARGVAEALDYRGLFPHR